MIDLILLMLLAWYAFAGFRRGLIVGGMSLVGLGLGAFAGVKLAPLLVDRFPDGLGRTMVIIGVVLGGAFAGQTLASVIAARLRRTAHRSGIGPIDHALGAVAAVIAASLVIWFVAGAVRQTGVPVLGKMLSTSRVLGAIDTAVPTPVSDAAAAFRRSVADSEFPRVFEGLSPETIAAVPAPGAVSLNKTTLAAVRRSTVKVMGEAPECGRGQEGSGVVVAPQRVVTNAHVVAGVRTLQVYPNGSRTGLTASVVLFDPSTDVAVLAVPQLKAPVMSMSTQALSRGQEAVLTGFPLNGPYVITPARVRAVVQARGEDIYGRAGISRQVYSLYATVKQGNSGGPMVDSQGSLVGLVFATSLDDPHTGYALTLNEFGDELAEGVSARQPVGTGRCVGD